MHSQSGEPTLVPLKKTEAEECLLLWAESSARFWDSSFMRTPHSSAMLLSMCGSASITALLALRMFAGSQEDKDCRQD